MNISAEELFSALTPPKNENFIGQYHWFLSHELIENLKPTDFGEALKWVENQNPRSHLPRPFQELLELILIKTWDNLFSPDLISKFAKAILSRIKKDYAIVEGDEEGEFNKKIFENDRKRHQIFKAMLSLLGGHENDITEIAYSPFAPSKDFSWMVDVYLASTPGPKQQALAQLLRRVFDPGAPEHFEAVYRVSQSDPILAKIFEWLLKPILLNTPEAKKLKREHNKRQKLLEDRKNPPLNPPPKQRIKALLNEFESGNLAAWWSLNLDMTLKPNSRYYGDEFETDLTRLPGWEDADSFTRSRIIKAAQKYLLEQDPKTHEWLGKDILHRPALAGYRALQLLMQEAPDFFAGLPPDIWKKWAPITLAYPTFGGDGDKNQQPKIIKKAYEHASNEIIDTLMILIDKENKEHDFISIIRKISNCWDKGLENALIAKAKDRKLKPKCMEDLLEPLIEHKVKEGKSFAESLIRLPTPRCGEERSRAIIAGRALMKHAEDVGWSSVWPAIEQDTDLGREIIFEIERDTAKIWTRLTEDQLADLYIWLACQYPHSEDPDHKGGHWVGPREQIARLRDSIINHIKERGTRRSCEVISHIAQEFPELGWLKWVLLEAQNITRHRTWVPPRPRDILKLAKDRQIRLVQNGDQLLDVLVESLRRLEEKLQGENPAAIDLWNEIGRNIYRPKDESRLSDYVKRHLEEDLKRKGVVANREVEIRRGEGEGVGERTDIDIDAIKREPNSEIFDSVSVIIEVKGCWNPELEDAMKTQLVDRYLKDNRCQHGLYLVGWFNCPQWDDSDYRKGKSPESDRAELQKQFDTQAADISQQGVQIRAFVMNAALR